MIRSRSMRVLHHRCRTRRECCCGNQPTPWFLTMHAIKRMREMGLDRSEVVAALDDPEVQYPDRLGHLIACGGRLAVCFTGDTVVTVLWRGREFVRAVC
jgi:hypothetical protein